MIHMEKIDEPHDLSFLYWLFFYSLKKIKLKIVEKYSKFAEQHHRNIKIDLIKYNSWNINVRIKEFILHEHFHFQQFFSKKKRLLVGIMKALTLNDNWTPNFIMKKKTIVQN